MSEDEEQLLHSSDFPPTTGYKTAEEDFCLDNMSPFLTFFVLGEHRGFEEKKVQNQDSMNQ